ncbi:right-handed parallel beta-helix repeat-containing protein [Halococcus sp. AFM35]|uniref:right-handed parallel beta-helix repeat-containing protein n=1 Tax=Halococcus sp. AFM35 TaxID=3421653 RepID=UPI003EB6F2EC
MTGYRLSVRQLVALAGVVLLIGAGLSVVPAILAQDNGGDAPTPGSDGDINCSEFDDRQEVDEVFDPNTDEFGLDSDDDNIACEDVGDDPTPEEPGTAATEEPTATATETTTETATETPTPTETTEEATETETSTEGAASTATPTEIGSCTQITEPGRYVLTADIENSTADQCIQIFARDVVLDGAGHTIDGVDDFPTDGIVVFGSDGATNVTVTNATVTDWGGGIEYEASTGEIRDSVVASNSRGIAFTFGAGGIVVANNTIAENDQGIYLQSSSDNAITNTTASGNGQAYYSDSDPQEGPSINNTVRDLHLDSATVSFESKDVAVRTVGSSPTDPDNRTNIGQYVNASANSPDSFFDVSVSYEENDLGGVDESTLELWRYDGDWSKVSESTVDMDANAVSANITEFANGSIFAPLGRTADGGTGDELGQNDEDDDGDGHIDEDGEDGNDVPSNDDDDGDGAVDEDDEPDDGDDGSDDFNGEAEDDDDGDGHYDEDDENDGGNSDDEDNDGDGAIDEDDEPDTDD